jgi:hypothetical protein
MSANAPAEREGASISSAREEKGKACGRGNALASDSRAECAEPAEQVEQPRRSRKKAAEDGFAWRTEGGWGKQITQKVIASAAKAQIDEMPIEGAFNAIQYLREKNLQYSQANQPEKIVRFDRACYVPSGKD